MLCYTFDGDSGTNVLDSSGNGNNWYHVRTIAYEGGIRGMASRFTSKNTYIVSEAAGLNANGGTGLTVSAWICKKAYTTYGHVIDRGGVTTTNVGAFELYTQQSTLGAQFAVRTDESRDTPALSSSNLHPDGTAFPSLNR